MNDNQYVVFRLDGQFYGLKIDNVQTIVRMMDLTRVPHTPPYVRGVINLRGEIVPVVDLRERLGLPCQEADSKTRIIVDHVNDRMIGYIVDSITEVKKIPLEAIDTQLFEDSSLESVIQGVGKVEEAMVILLDIEKIIDKQPT